MVLFNPINQLGHLILQMNIAIIVQQMISVTRTDLGNTTVICARTSHTINGGSSSSSM